MFPNIHTTTNSVALPVSYKIGFICTMNIFSHLVILLLDFILLIFYNGLTNNALCYRFSELNVNLLKQIQRKVVNVTYVGCD